MMSLCQTELEPVSLHHLEFHNRTLHSFYNTSRDHPEHLFQDLPGYGTLPLVTSSVSRIPKDQTSDLMVNFPYRAASGAVHLIGNFAPRIQTQEKERDVLK